MLKYRIFLKKFIKSKFLHLQFCSAYLPNFSYYFAIFSKKVYTIFIKNISRPKENETLCVTKNQF